MSSEERSGSTQLLGRGTGLSEQRDFLLKHRPGPVRHRVRRTEKWWEVKLCTYFPGISGTLSDLTDRVWRLEADEKMAEEYVVDCSVMDVNVKVTIVKKLCGKMLVECRWCPAQFDIYKDDSFFFDHVRKNHLTVESVHVQLKGNGLELEYIDQVCWKADRTLRHRHNWSVVPQIVMIDFAGQGFLICPYCKCVSRDLLFDMGRHYVEKHMSFYGHACQQEHIFRRI